MATAAAQFRQQLGADLAFELQGHYTHLRSRGELRRTTPDGHDVLILSVSAKHSPFVSVAFYFGRNYAVAKRIEKLLRGYEFPYHIQQFSLNRRAMAGIPYDGPYQWSIDIRNPPQDLAKQVAAAVLGVAVPFFVRFSSIAAARDALANNDPWCFGGPVFWRQLLIVDLALDDLAHFQKWAVCLQEYDRNQSEGVIRKFQEQSLCAV